jgi:putative ABC transport system permease protein
MRLEHWFYTIPLRLRSMFRRSQMERELEEELQLHLAQRIEQGVAMGQTPDEARYAALRAMEGMEQRKEECRDARRVHWLEDMLQDIRYAFRVLTKTRGFTAVAALVLALGIGANSAVFTIVNGVLLRPLPYNEPGRLFLISYMPKNNPFVAPGPYMSDRDYLDFRSQDQVFASTATFGREPATLTGAGDPVVLNALTVTPDFFAVLRVHPAIGRAFLSEGQTDANVVMLSDRLWHSRFGADPTVAGKAITLDGISYAVVGVMPPNFTFQDADLWERMEVRLNPHNSFTRPVIGRLKAGVSPREAQAELQAFAAKRPLGEGEKRDDFVTRLLPLQELFVADVRKLLLIFAGAVAFVFLIACANFANLLLIRGTSRRQEIAVRAALGASRWRLVRQLLAESTLLSLAGGTVGVLLSMAGVRALLALLPPGRIPRAADVHLDVWVVAFTFGLSLATGLIFGLAPALQATRRDLREGMNGEGRGITGRHERLRSALVMAEIALALVLLTGAGLLVRSFLRMRSVNPGFRPANILAVTVDLPDSRYATAAQMRAFDERVLADLSVLPGTESVAAVNWIPFRPEFVRGDFQLADGRHLPRGFLVVKPVVSPGYFRTMGIRLLNGRAFSERDTSTTAPVAIISESVARLLWPDGDAVGKRISMEDEPKAADWLTIVGIVRDVKQESLIDTPSPSVYQPYRQINRPFFLGHMSFVVQARGNQMEMASGIRAVLHKVDQELPTQSIATMEAMIAETVTEVRSQTRLLGIFSIMALALAAVGIYGVLACSVAERTHEIGIRMAMGAKEKDVLWMVLRRTLVLVAGGVLIGTLGALAITRVLTKFLFEVTPSDPATLLAVTVVLAIVALLSGWIPAQRAARVYPLVALRHE